MPFSPNLGWKIDKKIQKKKKNVISASFLAKPGQEKQKKQKKNKNKNKISFWVQFRLTQARAFLKKFKKIVKKFKNLKKVILALF